MAPLTLDQVTAKITTAEAGLEVATTQYDRNVLTGIRDEYRRYSTDLTKQLAARAAADD
jgi:hypothetical protein